MRLRLHRGRQRAGRGRAVGQAAHDSGAGRRGVGEISAKTAPPFRADHVGSLLRPLPLKQARAKRERGEITGDQLKAVEDREIAAVIKRQEDIGLKAVTDGEFRRAFWNYDFLGRLDGVEAYLGERKIKFQGPNPKPLAAETSARETRAWRNHRR